MLKSRVHKSTQETLNQNIFFKDFEQVTDSNFD